jgi:hemin uptake protein HemP
MCCFGRNSCWLKLFKLFFLVAPVGDTVTLTAIPNEGYRLVRWSNEVIENPYTFIINENVALFAEFEKEQLSNLENIPSPISNSQKLLRNGQLYIYHNGSTYNAMGMEL